MVMFWAAVSAPAGTSMASRWSALVTTPPVTGTIVADAGPTGVPGGVIAISATSLGGASTGPEVELLLPHAAEVIAMALHESRCLVARITN